MENMQDTEVMDRSEQAEWLAALDVLIEEHGKSYGESLLAKLASHMGYDLASVYWNSKLEHHDIDIQMCQKASALVRWNAVFIVQNASKLDSELGGHMSTFASCYALLEIGNYYFFKGSENTLGDLIFYQGHASPGNYASSYLMDKLTLKQIENFRREVSGEGISSYPHPWLMPEYWQFPTVSMGLGPIQAIYQAKLIKYLAARQLLPETGRKVYAFLGDGEMDEVESLGALGVATREGLDNLVFIVNCNLVRLDGPCRGNGQIIQELSRYFSGFGWSVIKLVWSQAWLDLIAKDDSGYLQQKLMQLYDGEIQALYANNGLKEWLEKDEKTASLVEGFEQEDFDKLLPGGQDLQLVANAFKTVGMADKPCVLLVMTEKGYGLQVASHNTSHNKKSLSDKQLKAYAEFLGLDEELKSYSFHHPGKRDKRIRFMQARRKELGGHLPQRKTKAYSLKIMKQKELVKALKLDVKRSFSTTMGFVRILNVLLRDKNIKDRLVPILADEGRSLGMEGLFSKIGIYHSGGQKYVPHDRDQVSYYKESENGQLIQEGLSEAGAMAMWMACATSYSVHGLPLIPIYSFYSMFGFQRVGDMIHAAADCRSRGFLMGGTSGKTTLAGEGLQHCDGTSLLSASAIPNCKSYDPCFAYEMAVIMHKGLEEMYELEQDVFYYISMMNENYPQPEMPKGVEEGIIKGMYCLVEPKSAIDILASGAILHQAILASEWLQHKAGVPVKVWSVTSYCELYREAECAKRDNQESYLGKCLEGSQLVVACSDYVKALPSMIYEHTNRPTVILGTDGFGMSDTRDVLREYYGVSHQGIARSVIMAMVDVGLMDMVKAKKLVSQLSGVHPLRDDRRKA